METTTDKYTEQQIRTRYSELFPYDDPISIWEIRDLHAGDDLDKALNDVYNARLANLNRRQAQRRESYWHPFNGAVQRWKASLENETNPLIGMERVFGPAIAMTSLLRNPIKVGGAMLGSSALVQGTNTASEIFTGKDVPTHISNATGLTKFTSERINPFAWIGGLGGQREAGKIASKYLNKAMSKLGIPIQYTSSGFQKIGAQPTKQAVHPSIPFYFSLIPDRYIPEHYKLPASYEEVTELTPEKMEAVEQMKQYYTTKEKNGGIMNYTKYFI